MSKRIPVPRELEHLIEKRESESERRLGEQRNKSDQRKENLGPVGAIESAADIDDIPTTDRRNGSDRRKQKDRRKKPRRTGDV